MMLPDTCRAVTHMCSTCKPHSLGKAAAKPAARQQEGRRLAGRNERLFEATVSGFFDVEKC